MKKKLLGLAAALGIAALASWAAPAAAAANLLPCHLRLCLAQDPNTQCYCLYAPSQISTCGTFHGSCPSQ